MSTGEVLRVRAAMKPISTVPRALDTVDMAGGEPAVAIHQRSDVCAVPAAGVVAEAMVALVLADAVRGEVRRRQRRRDARNHAPTSPGSPSHCGRGDRRRPSGAVLVGPPGSGKTTGAALAELLGVALRDTDSRRRGAAA